MIKHLSKAVTKALLLCVFVTFGMGALVAQSYETELVTTSKDWTIPADVSKVKVEAWGGGGAGGYARLGASSGGGGGAYAGDIVPVSGGLLGVTVGVAGKSSSSSSSIVQGGTSIIKYPVSGTIVVSAEGGKSVTGTNNGDGASGGQASNCTGQWKFSGGNGGARNITTIAGGGGGAAGSTSQGSDGLSGNDGGNGGSSGGDLGGNGGQGRIGTYAPLAGSNYGGGGSGVVTGIGILGTNPSRMNGGAGAPGVVRLTYLPFYIKDITVYVANGGEVVVNPVSNLTNLKFSANPEGNDCVSLSVNTDTEDQLTITNVANSCNTIQTYSFNAKGVWTDNIDTERGFDTLMRNFTITVIVMPAVEPGTISEEIVTCTADDTLKKFTNLAAAVNNIDLSGNTLPYCWQYSEDNTTWVIIPSATGAEYTPAGEFMKSGWFRRGAYNAVKDTAFTDAIHTSVGNVSPGEITEKTESTPQGEYCYGTEISAKLKANPQIANEVYQESYTIQWQKKVDNGDWTDIAGATDTIYNEEFTFSNDSVIYRYMFKFAECVAEPSANIYSVKVLVANDYYSPVLTQDLEITLYYGACDTAVVIPELDPEPLEISCSPARISVGENTVTWTVKEPCGGTLTYEQKITVNYPECESAVSIDGISHNVVRVGCDCWLAENLNIDAENATYYNEDASNAKFGKLYSWYAAMNVTDGDNEATPEVKESMLGSYIQGICPEGWAIPSVEQFTKLNDAAGGSEKLKSTDVSTWLPEKAGVDPVSGFNAVGAGYYDADVNSYYKMLGVTQIWTSEVTEHSVKGTCSRIDYSCPEMRYTDVNKSVRNSVRCVRVEPKN